MQTAATGRPLAGTERHRMESIVGGDLSGAVLHTDAAAADRAARAGALAVTEGPDIAFAQNAYRPGTPAGDALLAHELAHVRQQRGGGPAGGGHAGGLEREADHAGFLAAAWLLNPGLARSLPQPRVSTGHGMRLQRCTPERYDEIGRLPSRAEYEQSGELGPIGAAPAFDLAGTLDQDIEAILAPDHEAEPLTDEQLRVRLAVVQLRDEEIRKLTPDLAAVPLRDERGDQLVPGLTVAAIGAELDGAGPRQWDPATLSRLLPLTEAVQTRAHAALLGLARLREQEIETHGAFVADGYDLDAATAEIDAVRAGYVRAAADAFDPDQGRLLTAADRSRAGLNSRLTGLLLAYHQNRTTEGEDIAPAMAEVRDWAWQLSAELGGLDGAAQEIRAAVARGEDVTDRQRAFTAGAQLVATSLDALGEWDVALNAYETLRDNSALWGGEAVLRVAERMSQMKNASLAGDEPYLRLLIRDHREDPALQDFYASIPGVLSTSHLVLGFVVLLIASAVTAGVGVAIMGAATAAAGAAEGAALAAGASASTAAAEGTIVLEYGLLAKIGGEAAVFTIMQQGLTATLPGLGPELTVSSFLTELVWNLGLFGVLHGVGSAVEGAMGRAAWVEALAPAARTAVLTGAKMGGTYLTLEAYGALRFLLEEGRWMTPAEIAAMSAQNLVMMAGLTIAMKPLEPILQGLGTQTASLTGRGIEALVRFRERYGTRFLLADQDRLQLEVLMHLRMREKPQATEAPDIQAMADELDARLRQLVADASGDPEVGLADLRYGLTGVAARAEATPVPRWLAGLGVPETVGLRSAGDESTWTIGPGQSATVQAALAAREVPLVVSKVSGARVLELTIPGRGPVTLVEPPGPVVVPTPVLDTIGARDEKAANGLKEILQQTVVPGLVIHIEERAAQGDRILATQLLRAADQLSRGLDMALARDARRAAAATPASEETPTAKAPAEEPPVMETPAGEAPADLEPEVPVDPQRAHMLALDAALEDQRAAAGLTWLTKVGKLIQVSSKAAIIASAAPENMTVFLRALADNDLHSQPVEFYQVLARNRKACVLVDEFGGRVLLTLMRLQPDGSPELRLARARVDVERVLNGLRLVEDTDAARARAVAGQISGLPDDATFSDLDTLVGARPAAGPAFEKQDAGWEGFMAQARDYARRHPLEDGPLTEDQLKTRAILLQVVWRAKNQEFGDLSGDARQQMLDTYNDLAVTARLDRGWISSTRGTFNEWLARGAGRISFPVAFLNGELVVRGTDQCTIPDGAVPPVRDTDTLRPPGGLSPVELTPRLWIEEKSYELGQVFDALGVSQKAVGIAAKHAEQAAADLTNLPTDRATIELSYAADPGLETRIAMLRKLFVVPRVVQVRFKGRVYTRLDVPPPPPKKK